METQRNIYLIGFSGCGKSTVGELLAGALKTPFYDTDRMIADKTGKDISRIFAEKGEAYFRRLEKRTMASLARRTTNGMVVALGGGAFEDKATRELLCRKGLIVYLSCSSRVLYSRLRQMHDRPLLAHRRGKAAGSAERLKMTIRQLLYARLDQYRMADITVSTSNRTVTETVRELRRRLKQYGAD